MAARSPATTTGPRLEMDLPAGPTAQVRFECGEERLDTEGVVCAHGDNVLCGERATVHALLAGWQWDGEKWICPRCIARLGHGVRDV